MINIGSGSLRVMSGVAVDIGLKSSSFIVNEWSPQAVVVVLFVFLSLAFLGINLILQEIGEENRSKLSPYECGFDPLSFSRTNLSNRFYVIALLFIVYDLEVFLITPLLFIVYGFSSQVGVYGMWGFMALVLLGTIYERYEGSIDWPDSNSTVNPEQWSSRIKTRVDL